MCLFAAAICAVYAGLLSGRSMSPAEGWYSYYAYIVNEEGAVPYVDFELLFPPLYTYIIALFTKIFGYELMALRVLGVVIYTLTGVFACLIFEKLTHKPWLGFLGGILTVAVLQSEVVQIFYDYIRVMDLFVYVSVYFFIRYLDRVRLDERVRVRFDINIVIATLFAVLASMCKQSSGLIFLLFCFAFFAFIFICLPVKGEAALQVGVMAGVSAVLWGVMVALMYAQGSLDAFINYNFVSSVDAKGGGSIFSILFGWIPRSGKELIFGALIMLAVAAVLVAFLLLNRRYPAEEKPTGIARYLTYAPALLLVALLLIFVFSGVAWGLARLNVPIIMYVAFLFCTVFFAVCCFAIIFRKRIGELDWHRHIKYTFLSGVIFTLAFSVCTSGGLAESQIALGYAFVPVVLIGAARFCKKDIAILSLCAAMLLQTSVAFGRKVNEMYAWWGLSTGGYSEQTVTCDVPVLKGIKMSPAYAKMYNDVYYGVTENTAEGEEIFVFPHMPVLYLATDRPRATQTAIQWFDVSTDAAVMSDIDTIKEKMPRVMVICTVGEYVISAHESNFRGGSESGLHAMQDFLFEFVEENGYECLSENALTGDYVVSVWLLP